MKLVLRTCLVTLLAGGLAPVSADAQLMPGPLGHTGYYPAYQPMLVYPTHAPRYAARRRGIIAAPASPACGCRTSTAVIAPPPIFQPRAIIQPQPVVEMQYQAQQVTSYVNVPKTQYHREAVVTQVPVRTEKKVTVDEGGYQMVWVPKVVTKSVPTTTYQQQTTYRNVPYQTYELVAQTHTRLVPQPVVRQAMLPPTTPCEPTTIPQQAALPQQSGIPQAIDTSRVPEAATAKPSPQTESTDQPTEPQASADVDAHGWTTIKSRRS